MRSLILQHTKYYCLHYKESASQFQFLLNIFFICIFQYFSLDDSFICIFFAIEKIRNRRRSRKFKMNSSGISFHRLCSQLHILIFRPFLLLDALSLRSLCHVSVTSSCAVSRFLSFLISIIIIT